MHLYRTLKIGRVFFLLFFLWSCGPSQQPVYVEGTLIAVDSLQVQDKNPGIDSVIASYRDALEDQMNEVLAYSAQTMSRGTPEGLLNNFVADLCLEIGRDLYRPGDGHQIDFALLNYGGLRASIRQGPVTLSNVFELMPFENEMVVLTLSPEKTLELFDYLAETSVGMPVSGLRINIENNEVKEVSIRGEEFDPDRNYKVLSSDYLAGGGDNMTFFLDPVHIEVLDMKIRDAIIKHLRQQDKEGKEIKSSLDGRLSY
jgi:2',3'-cyclic-nucleotide 2'-phosphodiesterase (5'-nucleotidase family)